MLARRGPAAIYRAEGSADAVLDRAGRFSDALVARARPLRRGLAPPQLLPRRADRVPPGRARRIGYATDRRGLLLTDAAAAAAGNGHQLRDYDALLSDSGRRAGPRRPAAPDSRARPRSAPRRRSPRRVFRRAAARAARPGQRLRPTKRWPARALRGARRHARRAAELRAHRSGRGAGRSARALRGVRASRSRSSARTSIRSSSPRLAHGAASSSRTTRARCTSPAAVGTPVVAFFGPTDPGPHRPVGLAVARPRPLRLLLALFPDGVPVRARVHAGDQVEMALRACEELLESRSSEP